MSCWLEECAIVKLHLTHDNPFHREFQAGGEDGLTLPTSVLVFDEQFAY